MPPSEWFYIEKWKKNDEEERYSGSDDVLCDDDDFTLCDDVPIVKENPEQEKSDDERESKANTVLAQTSLGAPRDC